MAKKSKEEIEPTIYDRPSDKYPGIETLGVTKARQSSLRGLLGALRVANAEKREAEQRVAKAYAQVIEALEKFGFEVGIGSENAVRFWSDIPWTIYRGTNTRLVVTKLLELGVSAEQIEAATVSNPHGKVTIKAVEERDDN